MNSFKRVVYVYILIAACLFPSVFTFDFGNFLSKIEKAQPKKFFDQIVNTFQENEFNETTILDIVSQGVKIASAFAPKADDDVGQEESSSPADSMEQTGPITEQIPTNDDVIIPHRANDLYSPQITEVPIPSEQPSRKRKMVLEFTRTTGGVLFQNNVFIPDSYLDILRLFVPGFKSIFPENPQENSLNIRTTQPTRWSEEYYDLDAVTQEPLENQRTQQQETITVEVDETTDGVIINGKVFILEAQPCASIYSQFKHCLVAPFMQTKQEEEIGNTPA